MGWSPDPVRVRVPATSANLGPGFDALGLALSLHDDVEAWVSDSGLSVEICGEGEDLAKAGEDHLVVRAMRAAFEATGGQPPGIGLRCVNRIPHGRGLGSSAAAIVAGLLAARSLAGDTLGERELLELATAMEGHPDNVAAWTRSPGPRAAGSSSARPPMGEPRMVRLEPLPSVMPVVCVAPAPVRTDVARGLLPDVVPHEDAAAGAGRSALLVAALTQPAGAGVLFDATQDWLHQDYRAAGMPETGALVRMLRDQGIPAVVSGAGPSVLALLTRGPDYGRHLDTLGSIVRETGIAWHISSLEVERQGARVLRPEPPSGC